MKRYLCMASCSLLLVACGGDHEDVRLWMKESTKDIRPGIPPLPSVVAYQPVPYLGEKTLDPFAIGKLEPESRQGQGAAKGLNAPDFEARNERNNLLEKFPLESINMIGYLNVNHQAMAVVQVDKHVRQVKKGDYVGQDFGFVTEITEQQTILRELVQDSAGDWTERTSILQLQAKEGSKK